MSATTEEPPIQRDAGSGALPARRCARGDADPSTQLMRAIEVVYRNSFSTFHRVASAITGDADRGRDAVQEAFVRAIRRRADFRGDGPLEGWLWRTVINVAKDQCRTAKGGAQSTDLIEDLPDVSRNESADLARDAIRGRVAELPERQRLALFLRYYVDMSYAEIGEALGIRTGTVSATLNAAHRALRATLQDAVEDRLPGERAEETQTVMAAARRRRRPELPMSACVGARGIRRQMAP
jgi:RNA polymerase sigma-70 factor (ECF subfamily)